MLNVIALNGRLTADPEIKSTPNGVEVCSFDIAVERDEKTKDGERVTDFVPCVAWRNTAQFVAKYYCKGDMIGVTGKLQTRKYTDKQGNNRTAYEVLVGAVSFCGGKTANNTLNAETRENGSNAAEKPAYTPPTSGTFESIPDDDDLPF